MLKHTNVESSERLKSSLFNRCLGVTLMSGSKLFHTSDMMGY